MAKTARIAAFTLILGLLALTVAGGEKVAYGHFIMPGGVAVGHLIVPEGEKVAYGAMIVPDGVRAA